MFLVILNHKFAGSSLRSTLHQKKMSKARTVSKHSFPWCQFGYFYKLSWGKYFVRFLVSKNPSVVYLEGVCPFTCCATENYYEYDLL